MYSFDTNPLFNTNTQLSRSLLTKLLARRYLLTMVLQKTLLTKVRASPGYRKGTGQDSSHPGRRPRQEMTLATLQSYSSKLILFFPRLIQFPQ